jgi:hypothetical protein
VDSKDRRAIRDLMRALERYREVLEAHQAAAGVTCGQMQALMRTLEMQRDCDRCGDFRFPYEGRACTCPERCVWKYCQPVPDLGPRELWPGYCRGLSLLSAQVTVRVVAALDAAAPLPVSTAEVEQETGYGIRYGQLCYRMLRRLARLGEAEQINLDGARRAYWRRLGGLEP